MIYWFKPTRQSDFTIKERNSGCRIDFYSKEKMAQLFPDGGFVVIGEICNRKKKYPGQDVIMTNAYIKIPVFPRGSIRQPFEWIAGYAPVGDDMYVAVVKSIIPVLI